MYDIYDKSGRNVQNIQTFLFPRDKILCSLCTCVYGVKNKIEQNLPLVILSDEISTLTNIRQSSGNDDTM